MSRRTRNALAVPLGLAVLAGLLAAAHGLPAVGHVQSAYGDWVTAHAVGARATTDTVIALTFDFRGFDTLGEEFILLAAVAACPLILRSLREDEEEREEQAREAEEDPIIAIGPIRAIAAALVAPTIVLGAYVVAHGHISPGGGFQGGVILASLALLLFIAGPGAGHRSPAPLSVVEAAEALGAAAYALLGVGGLIFAAAFFQNFLGTGTAGQLVSAGTIPFANVAIGVEVAAGFTVLFAEFLEHAVARRMG